MRFVDTGRQRRSPALAPLLAAAFFVAAAGCSGATTPGTLGSAIRVLLVGGNGTGIVFDEQTIAVGATLTLRAEILDATGKPIPGESVDWRSDAPNVASVTSGGVVQALSLGTARIIASHPVGEDTARINVAEPVSGAVGCESQPALSLAIGAIYETTADQAALLCLPGGAEGAEYTIVSVNAARSGSSTLSVLVEATGTVASATFSAVASSAASAEGAPRPRLAAEFHREMRERSSRLLEGRLRAGPGLRPSPSGPSFNVAPGQLLSYNVATSGEPCSQIEMRGGRVRVVSDRAIVVADTLNPAGGFTDDDYRQFATEFDSLVWPTLTDNFGEPSDIDGNRRVVIFFTRAVNALPDNRRGGGTYIGGFFYNRDLFPKSGTNECAGSNATEIFYMLVPNPNPTGDERLFEREFVRRVASTVLAHEFQHLINDSRRLHENDARTWEETWLNEGLSHVAEELVFYRASGLKPHGNLGRSVFQTSPAARDWFNIYQLDNYDRWTTYLRSPEYASLMGFDMLATRGAAWSFLRYAADRRGVTANEQRELWRALVRDTRTSGLANLRQGLGNEPLDWIADWGTAIFVDDLGFEVEPRFRMPSWNFRDLAPVAADLWSVPKENRYPLRVQTLLSGLPTMLPLQGGGAGYLRAIVPSGGTAVVRTRVGTLPGPSRLRVTVVRSR